MPELDPVTQEITAQASEYLATLDEMIARAEEFAAAVRADESALAEFGLTAAAAAAELGAAANQAADLSRAISGVAASTAPADAALSGLDGKLGDLIMLSTATVSELHDVRTAMAGVALASAAMGAASGAAATKTAAAGAAAGVAAGFWGRWGNIIHWAVMGTLEVAATAIPALVALGAAAGAMAPTFIHMSDVMNELYTSTGGLGGALRASVPQLQAMGVAGAALQKAVAPDAYIIFGSAIMAITSHVGAFSGVAQQASNVLAQFATKIVTDLQGSAGQALVGFFANAVKYMIQWGQVLGNLGHTFLNAVNAMWGVGQLLLDVLVEISHALLVISSNPAGAWLIGWAAAASAAYRYGRLLVTVFNLLGGSALVNAIKWAVGYGSALVALAGEEGIAAAASLALGDAFVAATGPIGIALGALALGFGIWKLNSYNAVDATQQLITKVESAKPTISNLTSGIQQLTGAIGANVTNQQRLATMTGLSGKQLADLNVKQQQGKSDALALAGALQTQATKLIAASIAQAELGQRTGQVGAAMQAEQLQIALTDSKVQQMSQNIDAYISLLTGGTSAVANFATAMSNIGSVTATTGINNLSQSTQTLTLNAKQFGDALGTMNVKGASAWQNLDQVISGSMAPMADWLRQAQVLGAVTGPQFSRAMLDMAASVIPYIRGNTTAQNSLLGFMAANGQAYPTFGKLESAAGSAGGKIQNLADIIFGATNAMSGLSNMAKNVAGALNSQVTGALATAALNSTHFHTDLTGLQNAMANGAGPSVIHGWLNKIAGDLTIAGQRGVNAGNQINSGMLHAGAGADTAAGKVQHLQAEIDGLHNKTVQITVNVGMTGNLAAYSMVSGGGGASYTRTPSGYVGRAAGGYIDGPGTKTSDSVPVAASRGEFMMSAAAVDHYGRGLMEAMNARRMAAGGPVDPRPVSPSVMTVAGGGGGGMTQLNLNSRTILKLDNTTVADQQRKEVLKYYRRNTGNNLALRTR